MWSEPDMTQPPVKDSPDPRHEEILEIFLPAHHTEYNSDSGNPNIWDALHRVGGVCGGHGDEHHGRKLGIMDWRRGSALITRGVDGAGEPDRRSGAAASRVKSQPLASFPYERGQERCVCSHSTLLPFLEHP